MRPNIFFVWIVCSLMSELSFQLIKVCFTRMYWLCVRVHVATVTKQVQLISNELFVCRNPILYLPEDTALSPPVGSSAALQKGIECIFSTCLQQIGVTLAG